MARTTLESKFGIDTNDLHPKSLNRFLDRQFDYVITVCDRAAESRPVFPGDPERIHSSFEDAAAVVDAEDRRHAFEQVAAGLLGRLRIWLAFPNVARSVKL